MLLRVLCPESLPGLSMVLKLLKFPIKVDPCELEFYPLLSAVLPRITGGFWPLLFEADALSNYPMIDFFTVNLLTESGGLVVSLSCAT